MKLERRARHKIQNALRIIIKLDKDGMVKICSMQDEALSIIMKELDRQELEYDFDDKNLYLQRGDSKEILIEEENEEKLSVEEEIIEIKRRLDILEGTKRKLDILEGI